MAIPSIGGNGGNLNRKNFAPKDKSMNNANQKDSSASLQAVAEDDYEYSIAKFKKDYYQIFQNQVLPVVAGYEEERKKRYLWAVIAAVLCSICGIFCFFYIHGRSAGDLAALCIAGAIGIWAWLKKSFERKIKTKIMPKLMTAFRGFYWQQTPPVSHEEICSIKIFPQAHSARRSFDDCFVGEYRGVKIAMSECDYEISRGKSTIKVFKGVVIKLKMNKNFSGMTIVRPKNAGLDDVSDLKKLKLEKIDLEDIEFNKEYNVYSTDQIEARYLLTTSFMERFKDLSVAFYSLGTYCSFYGDSVYIAPYSSGDLFNLFGLTKPVTDSKQFDTLFEEFVSILALVDHFKLDKKLGL